MYAYISINTCLTKPARCHQTAHLLADEVESGEHEKVWGSPQIAPANSKTTIIKP